MLSEERKYNIIGFKEFQFITFHKSSMNFYWKIILLVSQILKPNYKFKPCGLFLPKITLRLKMEEQAGDRGLAMLQPAIDFVCEVKTRVEEPQYMLFLDVLRRYANDWDLLLRGFFHLPWPSGFASDFLRLPSCF